MEEREALQAAVTPVRDMISVHPSVHATVWLECQMLWEGVSFWKVIVYSNWNKNLICMEVEQW
jgi:hypothetical protein